MGVLLLFFDGIGLGVADPARNPFAAIGARRLVPLAGGAPDSASIHVPLDAGLGVPGLPQSATGQTTLLTGVNAARRLGEHRTGIPGPSLWPLLERESLFRKLVLAGASPTFANAYTRAHLEAARPRWSATTRVVRASGVPFRLLDEEGRRGEALSHDYTGEWMRARGFDTPRLTARDAASVLAALVERHDLVLYEYFLTDLAGHRGSPSERQEQARRAEALVDAVVDAVSPGRHLVVVTSDHGNLEEASHARHTHNPVPFLVWGDRRAELACRVAGLDDVTPALIDWLAKTSPGFPGAWPQGQGTDLDI